MGGFFYLLFYLLIWRVFLEMTATPPEVGLLYLTVFGKSALYFNAPLGI